MLTATRSRKVPGLSSLALVTRRRRRMADAARVATQVLEPGTSRDCSTRLGCPTDGRNEQPARGLHRRRVVGHLTAA
jgi:hypothetical protein